MRNEIIVFLTFKTTNLKYRVMHFCNKIEKLKNS